LSPVPVGLDHEYGTRPLEVSDAWLTRARFRFRARVRPVPGPTLWHFLSLWPHTWVGRRGVGLRPATKAARMATPQCSQDACGVGFQPATKAARMAALQGWVRIRLRPTDYAVTSPASRFGLRLRPEGYAVTSRRDRSPAGFAVTEANGEAGHPPRIVRGTLSPSDINILTQRHYQHRIST